MITHEFSGKRVTVMGLGLHGGGVATVAWLVRRGARVLVTDLRTSAELKSSLQQLKVKSQKSPQPKLRVGTGQAKVKSVFGRHRKEDFIDTDMVVRNPAVPRESPYLKIAERHSVPIENEATLFFQYCRSKNIIGVTGTRGKSTTSAMIAAILKGYLNAKRYTLNARVWLAGNIRTTPMLSIVDRVKPNDWVVLELSSWHLEDMDRQKISPHVAVVTNLLQDHLNRYAGMRAYARAKEGIVRHQTARDIAVLNRENPWTRAMAKKTKAKVYFFSNYRGPSSVIQRTDLRTLGEHNRTNAEAAAIVAHALGISLRIIRSALRTFRGLPDRLEFIRTARGVRYYNDTTATTPDATIAALRTLARQGSAFRVQRSGIILIAGGSDKNLNYKPLIPWIKKTCKAVILFPGNATEKIKKLLYPVPSTLYAIEVRDMPSAVRTAFRLAHAGDIVLLSPAATSFGLFQHEFDRGEQFRQAVQKLKP